MVHIRKSRGQDISKAGKICMLDIDVQVESHTLFNHVMYQGCESVRKTDLNARFVMVIPPSIEDLVSGSRSISCLLKGKTPSCTWY